MKKSKIYTRSGDEGKTGLVSGNRIIKSDPRIALYGEVDELNSRIGFACALMTSFPQETKFIQMLQSSLFDLGSNMACEYENRASYKLPQLSEDVINEIEQQIDRMDSQLEPLKNFILPGGSLLTASLHLVRTGSRNVERMLVHYGQTSHEELPAYSLIFLNRLSDYFFVLARFLGKADKVEEILWKPRE